MRTTFFALLLVSSCGNRDLNKENSNIFEKNPFSCLGSLESTPGPESRNIQPATNFQSYFKAESEIAGIARLYERNENGKLIDQSIMTVGDTTLNSNRFITGNSQGERAKSSDFQFIYSPEDSRFKEASVFSNAESTAEWFKQAGFSWPEEKIGLEVFARLHGAENNALYTPSYNGGVAAIRIGQGDGLILKNLLTDRDVVMHELGHHILYQTITNISGDSLTIHEGIADIFVMLRNEDPCLGKSICVESSSTCVTNACLRTADNSLNWEVDGPGLQSRPHRASQILSGFFWDLLTKYNIPKSDILKLLVETLNKTQSGPSMSMFMTTLQEADQSIFEGKYNDQIKIAQEARGFR